MHFLWFLLIVINVLFCGLNVILFIAHQNPISLLVLVLNLLAAIFVACNPPRSDY